MFKDAVYDATSRAVNVALIYQRAETMHKYSFYVYILCFVHDTFFVNYPFYNLFIHMDFVLIYKMEWFLLTVKIGST